MDLRVSERGRERVLGQEALEKIAKTIDEQPDITLAEIIERLDLPVGIETVRRAILFIFDPPGWRNDFYDLSRWNHSR